MTVAVLTRSTGYTLQTVTPTINASALQTMLNDTTTYPNGSTVLVNDGDYDGVLTVPASRLLTIVAVTHGGVRIRGSVTTPITSGWTQVGATPVYQATVAHVVYGVMVSGRPFLKFTSLANLTNSFFGDGSTVAPPEGFFSQAGTLYLRLEGGGSPNGTSVTITRSGVTDTSGGTALTIPSSASITLEGITFQQWPRRAIFVDESGTIVALSVWFHNCYFGVQDPDTSNVPTSHIRLENCTYNLSGTAGTYNGPWAIRDALGESSQGTSGNPDGLYESNLGGKLCKVTCDDIQVLRCEIRDTFDCTEIKGRHTATDYGLANRTSYIRENLFWRFVDNGPEVEPGNRFTYMEIDHNIMVDGYVNIAMAPFLKGQIDVYNNVIYISEDWLADSGATVGTAIKHSGTSAFPGMVPVYPGSTPGSDLTVQKNIHVHHNTFLLGRSATQWARIVTADEASFTFTGTYYRDNITIHYKSRKWELGGYELSRYNLLWHGGSATEWNFNHYKHPDIGGTVGIWDGTVYETRPTTAPLSVDPQLGSTSTTRFTLQSGSPCISAASDGSDVGAVPFGSSWTMPTVGCTWAACIATRPAVPASIAASQMGL